MTLSAPIDQGTLAPEGHQLYGNCARQKPAELDFQKQVRVEVLDTDRYGRTIGRIWDAAVEVNAEMVRRGAAWVYRQYNQDAALPPLEAEARQARRGLWALPAAERQLPWIYWHRGPKPVVLERARTMR